MRQQLPALGLSLSRFPSVLLAVAVLSTLFAPALIQLTGRQTDPSFLDNRPPARMPALPSSFSLGALGQFRKELIAFIDDNFGLRAEMVKLNVRVRSAIGVSAIPGLFKGKEGWFFLKTDSDVLDQVRALNRFTDEELDEWIDLMEAQQRWVKAQGAAMVVVVAPNQHTIYPERMPLTSIGSGPRRGWIKSCGGYRNADRISSSSIQGAICGPRGNRICSITNMRIIGTLSAHSSPTRPR